MLFKKLLWTSESWARGDRSREAIHSSVLPVSDRSREAIHSSVLPVSDRSREAIHSSVLPVSDRSREAIHSSVVGDGTNGARKNEWLPHHDHLRPAARYPAYLLKQYHRVRDLLIGGPRLINRRHGEPGSYLCRGHMFTLLPVLILCSTLLIACTTNP